MKTWVYFLRPVGAEGPVKIGFSCNPHERLATYQKFSPHPLELVARIEGRETEEMAFHALFAPLHSHHEWFHAAPELSAVIAAINAGTFDVDTLPRGKRLTAVRTRPPESIVAAKYTRRVARLEAQGVAIPKVVKNAIYTYGTEPEEKARRRAVVAQFIDGFPDSQIPLLAAEKRAA